MERAIATTALLAMWCCAIPASAQVGSVSTTAQAQDSQGFPVIQNTGAPPQSASFTAPSGGQATATADAGGAFANAFGETASSGGSSYNFDITGPTQEDVPVLVTGFLSAGIQLGADPGNNLTGASASLRVSDHITNPVDDIIEVFNGGLNQFTGQPIGTISFCSPNNGVTQVSGCSSMSVNTTIMIPSNTPSSVSFGAGATTQQNDQSATATVSGVSISIDPSFADASLFSLVLPPGLDGGDTGTGGTGGPAPPPPPPSTLFTPQQKSFFGNAANVAGAAGTVLGLATFTGGVLAGTEGAIQGVLDYLGLAASSQAAEQILTAQVLQNGNLALAGIGVGLGCTVGAEFVVPCVLALTALELAVFQDLASAIQADPPDPGYQNVFVPTIESSPVPFTGVCSNLGSAAGATPYALDQTNEWLDALYITNNRYQTALAAGDMASATLQAAAFGSYFASFDSAAQMAAADLGCFANQLSAAGLGMELPTAQDEIASLDFLQTQNPSSLDSILSPFGFTDSEITTMIADGEADPPALPTETVVEALNGEAQSLTPVPEPSSLILLASGMISLLLLVAVRNRRVMSS